MLAEWASTLSILFNGLPQGKGNFVACEMAYSESTFLKFAYKAGVPEERVTTTPEFFDCSLSAAVASTLRIEQRRALVVHIDCDLYVSTRPVLEFLAPLLGMESVAIFDDWFSFDDSPEPWLQGEQRAFK